MDLPLGPEMDAPVLAAALQQAPAPAHISNTSVPDESQTDVVVESNAGTEKADETTPGATELHKRTGSVAVDDVEAHPSRERAGTLPTPLTLPKRFSLPTSPGHTATKTTTTSEIPNSEPKVSKDTSRNSSHPLSAQAQMPAYQQMLYNPQTGALIPIAAPVSTTSPTQMVPLQVVQPPAAPQYYPTVIPQVASQQLQQQVVYVRATNGQLVPVLTPLSSGHSQGTVRVPVPVPVAPRPTHPATAPAGAINRLDSPSPKSLSVHHTYNTPIIPASAANKRRKMSPLSASLSNGSEASISAAERLQRQQIKLQQQLHPNLSQEFESKNISDVYNSDEDHNHQEEKGLKKSPADSAGSSAGGKATPDASSSSRITGTLTLGSFTYKYSQTLSGDTVKDRALFDKLVDNAWRTCLLKRDKDKDGDS